MRRNKKVKRDTILEKGSLNLVTFIILVAFAFLAYWYQDSRCSAISQEIGRQERTLKALERDQVREIARFNEMTTPDKLSRALQAHGLAMNYARPDQVVKMNADGTVRPGQIAVARARARNTETRDYGAKAPVHPKNIQSVRR